MNRKNVKGDKDIRHYHINQGNKSIIKQIHTRNRDQHLWQTTLTSAASELKISDHCDNKEKIG